MTQQFCCGSRNEEEVLSEQTVGISTSKVLRLELTDIAGPSSAGPEGMTSGYVAKLTCAQEEHGERSEECCSESQSRGKSIPESSLRRSKRIRHTRNLQPIRQTPMGLPKPLRLPQKQFTIEEIYLNKNYLTPPEKSYETIFEIPKEHRDGTLMTQGRARKKRKCVFSVDFNRKSVKRKNRKGIKRKRLKIEGNADEILKQKLSNLDNALAIANLSP